MKKSKTKKDQRKIIGNGQTVSIPMPMMDNAREVKGEVFSLSDTLTLESPRTTRDGQLVVDIFAARVGVQEYLGSELGLVDAGVIKVYRPEEEVFDRDSLSTFSHRPVTNDHPPVLVDPTNYTQYANGFTGSDVTRVDDKVRMSAVIADKVLIDAIQAGKRELSAGYTCNIEFVKGVAPDGTAYDAIQRNVRINHVAVVDAGRAGKTCRIGDTTKDQNPMTTPNLKTVTFDGITVQTTDQGAEVIAKQEQMIADAKAENARLVSDHTAVVADKDKELGEKDAKIAKLEDEAVTPEQLDQMVADRAELVDSVKKLGVTVDTKGKSIADVRRAALVAKIGDAKVDGKSDEWVAARFEGLMDAAPDAFRSALIADGAGHTTAPAQGADKAYDEMNASLSDAWKGKES